MVSYDIETNVCLFDLDGTIVSTTVAAEAAWTNLCKKHNVDPQELFKVSHGSRTEEMLARFFPDIDNTDNKGVFELERSIADDYPETVTVIPGARDLLLSLDKFTDANDNGVIFKEKDIDNIKRRWAIVTSGTPYLAKTWFRTILKDVGEPHVFVTGVDVTKGKPDPEGYMLAKRRLAEDWGYHPIEACKAVVFEDAPVGIEAGKRMGAITVGLTTSYSKERMFAAGADYVVTDLTNVHVVKNPLRGTTVIRITDPLSRD